MNPLSTIITGVNSPKAKQVIVRVDGREARCGHDHPDHLSALPCTHATKKVAQREMPAGKRITVRQELAEKVSGLPTASDLFGWEIPYKEGTRPASGQSRDHPS